MENNLIEILKKNNDLLRENIAINYENKELSKKALIQINENINKIDELSGIIIQEKEFEIFPFKASVSSIDRQLRFKEFNIYEIEKYLIDTIKYELKKEHFTFYETSKSLEIELLICKKIN